MTVKEVFNRSNRLRADGTGTIHIRVTDDQRPSYFNTGVSCSPTEFNRLDIEKSLIVNRFLSEAQAFIHQSILKNRRISPRDVIDSLSKKGGSLFIPWVREQKILKALGEGTIGKHNDLIGKLKMYNEGLSFDVIDRDFVDKFHFFLKKFKSQRSGALAINSIGQLMILLRSYCKIAERKSKISNNPFDGFTIDKEQNRYDQLTINEIEMISKSNISEYHRDRFVFMCYTGLRVSDAVINPKQFKDGYLSISPKKTSKHLTEVILPIDELFWGRPLEILKKYDFSINAHSLKTFNDNILKVCKSVGIEKHITSKAARHSFITNLWEMGMPEEYISLMVGHKSRSMTSRYGNRPKKQIKRMVKLLFSGKEIF